MRRSFPQRFERCFEVYTPAADKPLPLLLSMHGYGGNAASMLRFGRKIAGHDFVVASLQGPHQHVRFPRQRGGPLGFGFGWISNYRPDESIRLHLEAVSTVIDRLATAVAASGNVFLLGFSQAVALNFRYAAAFPERIRGVVAICGSIPHQWRDGDAPATLPDVLCIGGRQDEIYPPAVIEADATRLRAAARSVELHWLPTGHRLPAAACPRIRQWLQAKAENMSADA